MLRLFLSIFFACVLFGSHGGLATSVPEERISAWVQPPDAWSLIEGQQEVLVRWQADARRCENPSFRVRISAGPGGKVVARRVLEPKTPHVVWGGFSLTVTKVPVTVAPLYAGLDRCCNNDCDGQTLEAPVRTFLPEQTWLGLGTQVDDSTTKSSLFLGTDGVGGVWLYLEDVQRLNYLPLLGQERTLPVPGGQDPIGVFSAGDELYLVSPAGIFKSQQSLGTWSQVFMAEDSPLQMALPVAIPEAPKQATGPCVVQEDQELFCWNADTQIFSPRGQLQPDTISAALGSHSIWSLGADGLLMSADLRGDAKVLDLQPRLRPSRLQGARLGQLPHSLALSTATQQLYLGSSSGLIWRLEFSDEAMGEVEAISLPSEYRGVRRLEADALGRVAVETEYGICTIQGENVGCHGAENGWFDELHGIGWAVPGVLWVGSRFVLAATPSEPVYEYFYGIAVVVALFLVFLMMAPSLIRIQKSCAEQATGLVASILQLVGKNLGWGIAVTALFLPQALILAVDRLLGDLDWPALPLSRIVPALFFLLAFLAALLQVAKPAQFRRLLSRKQFPNMVIIGLIWALYLLLWVWPGGERPPEAAGRLAGLHFLLALITGVGTLSYLFAAWLRNPAPEPR